MIYISISSRVSSCGVDIISLYSLAKAPSSGLSTPIFVYKVRVWFTYFEYEEMQMKWNINSDYTFGLMWNEPKSKQIFGHTQA